MYTKRCVHTLTASAIAFLSVFSAQCGYAQNSPVSGSGGAAAPDDWLLASKGPKWWYQTTPSPQPKSLNARAAKSNEQPVINEARTLMANRPAKAFALLDGGNVLYTEFKAPADSNSLLFGFSMGKTVTAMAVGQAICAGKLSLQTKASELIPKLQGKALGEATVHDLLRMSSGTAQINADSTIWNKDQAQDWKMGLLNLEDLISSDPVAQAGRGVFSAYKPGEVFAYKSTDPMTLSIMVSRAVHMPWSQWIQEQVLNPMGAAHGGLYVQDRAQNGLADSGMRLRLEDWMRFAVWVKESSKQQDCFGDFVRKAMSKQIENGTTPATRKNGKLFASYGYLTWTDNEVAPNTAWAVGWGGQRIGWNKGNDRMVLVFSNEEAWLGDAYVLAKSWGQLQ